MGILAGRHPAGRGDDGDRRAAVRAAKPDRGAPRRRGDDPPGAVARAAPHRCRRTSCSASSRRGSASSSGARWRRPRRAPCASSVTAIFVPTRSSARCPIPGAADRRDRAGHRGGLPRPGARRADQQPRPRGRAAALRACWRSCAARGTRSSTSRISSKRSPRSPIDSSCCATDGMRAAEPTAGATHDAIVGMMIGGSARTLFPRGPRQVGEPILTVDALAAGRRDVHAAPRRGVRHRRTDRRGPDAAAAHAVRPRTGPERPDHARRLQRRVARRTIAGSRAWAC